VKDSGGQPIAGAQVAWLGLLGDSPIQRSATSGLDGAYRIDGVPSPAALWNARSGLHENLSWLEARAPGKAPGLFEVTPGRPARMQASAEVVAAPDGNGEEVELRLRLPLLALGDSARSA